MIPSIRASLALICFALAGCGEGDADIANGDDPIGALAVPLRSDRYETAFWTQKSVRDPELWVRATTYCEGKNVSDHPNCAAVRYVERLDQMSRPPEDRPSDFHLTVPQAAEPNDEAKPQ